MKIVRWLLIFACMLVWNNAEANYKFEQRLEQYNQGKGPGLAVMVMQHRKITYSKGFGYANLENGTKITPNTTFDLASTGKHFAAMAVAMLQEQGKLDIEDKVIKYIPELPAYAAEVRVRHLLNHTSGLPSHTGGPTFGLCASDLKDNALSVMDIVDFLKKQTKLEFQPGIRHDYSNTGYVLLGAIVERVSHLSYEQFMRAIFDRLEMKDTFVISPTTIKREFARPYGGWPWFDKHTFSSCRFLPGDAGIYSSVSDLAKWALAIQDNKIISSSLKAKVLQPTHLDTGEPVSYGYGWNFDEINGRKWMIHQGMWRGSNSVLGYLESADFWIAVLANYDGPRIFASFIAMDIVEEILGGKPTKTEL